MSVFYGIVGLGFLILIHEAGHFFTALALHMRPRKFYIGFPPALVKLRRRGIEYGIGAIPLGGYVKIPGMHRPAAVDLELRLQRALREAPQLLAPLERVKRLLDAQRYDEARTALDELEADLRAANQPTEPLVDVRDSLAPDAYWRAPAWKRVAVIFAGPGTNLLLAVVLFAVLFVTGSGGYRLGFVFGTTDNGQVVPVVQTVVRGEPADRIGLQQGDRIVTVNGRRLDPEGIARTIRSSGGRPVRLTIERSGRTISLPAIAPHRQPRVSPPQAVWRSVKLTGQVSKQIVASLGNLVNRQGREQISSPVGITKASSQAVKQGWQDYFWILGLISLSLALLNLLPLLPLDGGHIFFSILEAIRGRAVPREIYERVSAIGIALVLVLFFIGLSNDVGNLGGG
jgi:regulator of sigma E protease